MQEKVKSITGVRREQAIFEETDGTVGNNCCKKNYTTAISEQPNTHFMKKKRGFQINIV